MPDAHETTAALHGSCACGQVKYEIHGELIGPVVYCHCWRCRKHSGSSFGTTAGVRRQDLRFTRGRSLLKHWTSSPGVNRYFAGCCGSPIYKQDTAQPDVYGFRLGTLDSNPGQTVQMHYMVDSTAPWVPLTDNLPRQAGGDGPFPGPAGKP